MRIICFLRDRELFLKHNVAVLGAGIIGITNAVRLLQEGFSVSIFTKDKPLETNSDAAVATWYIPDDSKPILQRCCLESLTKFNELIASETDSGVKKIPVILYFKGEEDFINSVWAKEPLKTLANLSDPPANQAKIQGFPFSVMVQNPLIDPSIYRPYMLKKFETLGGKLKIEKINALAELTDSYDIVVNSAGWEAKYLTDDPLIYPARGQTETMKVPQELGGGYSLNVEAMDAYVVFRPLSEDCVIGTTYQVGDCDRAVRESDKKAIFQKVATFFPYVKDKPIEATSKAGIRCGRPDVRIEGEEVNNMQAKQSLIVHCYGHGGTGYSASWGSADEVLKQCMSFIPNMKPTFR